MSTELIKPYEEKMSKAVEALVNDYTTVRAGRANPHILDNIQVEYYGAMTPLNQVGSISVPEARIIQIQPWDVSAIKAIEKALNMSDLGINPNSDGKVVRLMFPELTEDRRKELTKEVKKKAENAKVAVRNVRREALDVLKKAEKKKEITEDDLKSLEDNVQKLTDKFVAEIDKKCEEKTKDILAI